MGPNIKNGPYGASKAAINSLTISSNDGSGILQYSTFALYGIKKTGA